MFREFIDPEYAAFQKAGVKEVFGQITRCPTPRRGGGDSEQMPCNTPEQNVDTTTIV